MPPADPDPVPLSGYHSWPGIDPSGHVSVDREKVKTLAKKLESYLSDLLDHEQYLNQGNRLSPAAFGGWDAPKNLWPSVAAGRRAIAMQHARCLQATMDHISKLHKAAHVYDDEAALQKRVRAAIDHMGVDPQLLAEHSGSGQPAQTPGGQAPPGSFDPMKG